MSIWEFANPARFMKLSGRALPVSAALTVALLSAGLIWGFFIAPDDQWQGSTIRIIYLHVPAATMAINIYVMMGIMSLIWLIRRHHVSALAGRAAAPIGAAMTLIAIVAVLTWILPSGA